MRARVARLFDSWKPLRFLAIALVGLSSVPAAAVPLLPGEGVYFLDRFLNQVIVPATNLASDASLAGEVIARQSRPYSFEVVVSNPIEETGRFTSSGLVEDWVVRRHDTGTLDFYYRIVSDSFAGRLYRPWRTDSGSPIDVGYRDDVPPAGNPPTRVDYGRYVRAEYLVSEIGHDNGVRGSSAPVLIRSSFSEFATALGQLQHSVEVEFHFQGGGTMLPLFMPVPEPSTGMMAVVGLFAVVGVWHWKKRGAR